MKEFKQYQHLERFSTSEVQNIELGTTYVFPKIDGTNASVWLCDERGIQAGSRKRHLSAEADNAGFYTYATQCEKLKKFFEKYPQYRLFGEWLKPHSLRTYRDDAWDRFYVFDVTEDLLLHEDITNQERFRYVHYEDYKPMLEEFDIDFIPPIAIIKNGSYDQFIEKLAANVFLIQDGKGAGEGIVIKNYEFKNRFGRTTWAKIVTSEFKEKHHKAMGAPLVNGKKMVEEEIVEKFITKALVEKTYAKINIEDNWSSRMIPQLLHTVYYDLVREEAWEFVKQFKNPTINFGALQHMAFSKIKTLKPELF